MCCEPTEDENSEYNRRLTLSIYAYTYEIL